MRETILHIYNSVGSVVFTVFFIGFFAYLIFMVVSFVRRATSPTQKVSKEQVDRDVNEQW